MNLTQWVDAGTLDLSDTVVAQRLCDMAGESDSRVGLAVGLLVAALRNGSVCVDLASVRGRDAADVAVNLPWPEPHAWLAAVRLAGASSWQQSVPSGRDSCAGRLRADQAHCALSYDEP